MPWFFTIPEFIKKRACRYLLQHYLGQFLEEKISLDDLTVDLYNGTGSIHDVELNADAINEVLQGTSAPVKVISGYIGCVTVSVPWKALLKDNCKVEISGLSLCIAPDMSSFTNEDLVSMTDSLFFSMSSSRQMAEEVIRGAPSLGEADNSPGFEGMEALAKAIELVLSRVQITLTDTSVQISYKTPDQMQELFLKLTVNRIEFYDEMSRLESSVDAEEDNDEPPQPADFTVKMLQLSGLTIELGNTMLQNVKPDQSVNDTLDSNTEETQSNTVPIAIAGGKLSAKVRVKQNDSEPGPKLEVDVFLGSLYVLLSPQQLGTLIELLNGMKSDSNSTPTTFSRLRPGQNRPIPKHDMNTIESQLVKHQLREQKLQTRLQKKQDLFDADPYENSLTRHDPPATDMTESMNSTSDVFYSLNLNSSYTASAATNMSHSVQMEDSFISTTSQLSSQDMVLHPSTRQDGRHIHERCVTGDDVENVSFYDGAGLAQLSQSPPYGSKQNSPFRTGNNEGTSPYSSPPMKRTRSTNSGSSSHSSSRYHSNSNLYKHCPDSQHDVCKYSITFSGITCALLETDPVYTYSSSNTSGLNTTLQGSPSSSPQLGTKETSEGGGGYSSMDEGGLDPLRYFKAVSDLLRDGVNRRVLQNRQEELSQVLPNDHLLLWVSTVKTTLITEGPQVNFDLTVVSAELWEYLYRNQSKINHITKPVSVSPVVQLLEDMSVSPQRPCLKMKLSVSSTEQNKKRSQKPGELIQTSLDISLAGARINADVTLVDRLQVLLNSPERSRQTSFRSSSLEMKHSLYMTTSNYQFIDIQRQALFQQAVATEPVDRKEHRLNIRISCTTLDVSLRFPVPDLKETKRPPWYLPSLRNEVLYVSLVDVGVSTLLSSAALTGEGTYNVDCSFHSAKAYLSSDGSANNRELFLSISSSKDPHTCHGLLQAHNYGGNFDTASIRVVVQPASDSVLEQASQTEPSRAFVIDPDSFDSDTDSTKREPLPFSGKRSMFCTHREVDKDVKESTNAPSEELVMPGSPQEMLEFEQHAADLSQFSITISLPLVCIHLPSKQFLETIYNRFTTDLVLWQPASPASVEKANAKSMLISCMDVLQPAATKEDRFEMCKSVLKEENSDDETTDDVTPETGGYTGRGSGRSSASRGVSTQLAFSLTIQRGKISMLTDVEEGVSTSTAESPPTEMDSTLFQSATYDDRLLDLSPRSSHPPLPTHKDYGLALADLINLHLFSVSGYKGDPTHDYFCAQIQEFSLHHIGSLESIGCPLYSCVEEEDDVEMMKRLLPVIYRAKCGPTHKPHPHGESIKPMLSVAMEMKFDKERNSKTNKCAIALLQTTVQYHMSQPQHDCFKQLGDFFAISDEPVPGYEPPSFITELHVHLNNCGLTYKPLHLPLTLLLQMDTISLSTSVVTGSPVLVVRLMMDGTYLLLSNEQHRRHQSNVSSLSPVVSAEPVCVLEMEWFEMTFRLCSNDQFEGGYEKLISRMPDVSVECSSNVVHLRTCVDSCTALRDIIVYLSTKGDLQPRLDDGKPLRDYTSLGSEHSSLLSTQNSHPGNNSSPLTSLNGSESVDIGDLISEAMDDLPSPDTSVSMNTTAPSTTTRNDSKHRTNKDQDTKTKPTSSKPRMEIHMESDKSLIIDFESDTDESDDDHYQHHPAVVKKRNGAKGSKGSLLSPPNKSGKLSGSDQGSIFSESDEDFCIVDTPTSTRVAPGAKPIVKCLLEDRETLEYIENHFTIPDCRTDQLQRPKHFPEPVMQYTLKEMTLIWHFYGGRDFGPASPSSGSSSPASSPYSTRRQDTTHINGAGRTTRAGTNGSKSGFSKSRGFTEKSNAKKTDGRRGGVSDWKTAGGPGRDHNVLVELELDKLRFQYETYPKTTEQSSRLVLLVNDIEMRDKLMQSNINKFLYQYTTEAMPRQSHANMISLKLLFTRPELETQPSIEEAAIRLSILPIRLNMDQDTVLFIYNFFSQIGDSATVAAPVDAAKPRNVIRKDSKDSSSSGEDLPPSPSSQEVFIRSFVFHPDLPIRIDYESKGFHTEMGTLAGILLGLSHLNNSEVKLKSLTYKKGLLGWDKLAEYTCNEWVQDIRGYQLPLILKGVGPMHHVTQLVYGVMDLVRLPYQQYQEDGRIMWGLQRGATAFTSSTGVAVVELTSRLLETVQSFAQMAYDMVSTTERSSQALVHHHKPHEPLDFREGMANAYDVVYAGIEGTATDLYTVATKEHEERGVSAAMGGVLLQIPGTIVKPIILASEATRHVLGGVKNQFVPDARKEASEKWK